ncbi:hypothetical protein SLS58_001445 [Diplodia intermedia]|uniref:F-box domain protein n=1 Tax=Diplodia intermedia TaxID=856260 RepID=A0ABR3U2Y5_9PEZI
MCDRCLEIGGNMPRDLRKHARELVFDISTYNPDLLDFDCFLYLTNCHPPRCLRDDRSNEGHIEDSARIREWHDNAARECANDGDEIRRRQKDTVRPFFEWYQKRAQLHIANRGANAAFVALRNAIQSGWEFERVIITSLPTSPDHGNRRDKPFRQPDRSPEMKEWDEKIKETRGPIPWEEIQPRASWMTFDQQLPDIVELGNSGNTLDGCGEGMSSAIFRTNGPDMTRLQKLAEHLKVLRLVPEAVTDSDQTRFEYPGLRRLLNHASETLEELYLEFIHHKYMSSDRHLLRGLTFKRLRKMHFYDVRFTDVELFTFVSSNQHCLRRLIIDDCFMMDENDAILDGLEATGWWWPVLDELRSMGCFGEMELYIDSVAQQEDTLKLEGEPSLEEGMSRWKTWTAGGGQFPLLGRQDQSVVEMIPAHYRRWLRSALPNRRE